MLLTSIISKRSPEQLFSSKIFVKSNGGHFSEDKLFMFGCYWQLSQDHLDATFCTESISESPILVHRTIAKISCVVWLMVHYCGYIGRGRGWGAWGLNVIMHTGQAHCVNTQSTSICMHISYLPHNVRGTRLTPPATSHTIQQFATLAQGSCLAQWSSSNTLNLEGLQQQHHQHLKVWRREINNS